MSRKSWNLSIRTEYPIVLLDGFPRGDDPRLRVGVMRAAVGVSVGRSARRHKVDACSEQYARRDGAKVGFCACFEVGIYQAGIE